MARQFAVGRGQRLANRWVTLLIRLRLAPKDAYLLTVRGRRSGKPYTLPVRLVETAEGRWLVAPFGPVDWVRNARAAGRVTLSRGGRTEEAAVTELDARAAAPVLQRYLATVSIVRPYFDVKPDSPIDDFVTEAPRHPVFALS